MVEVQNSSRNFCLCLSLNHKAQILIWALCVSRVGQLSRPVVHAFCFLLFAFHLPVTPLLPLGSGLKWKMTYFVVFLMSDCLQSSDWAVSLPVTLSAPHTRSPCIKGIFHLSNILPFVCIGACGMLFCDEMYPVSLHLTCLFLIQETIIHRLWSKMILIIAENTPV